MENTIPREQVPPEPRHEQTFLEELAKFLNQHSAENASNTPDFILASYLLGCLDVFNASVAARDRWYHGRLIGPADNPSEK